MTGTDTTCPGVGHPTVRLETAVAIGDHTQMITTALVNGHLISKKTTQIFPAHSNKRGI